MHGCDNGSILSKVGLTEKDLFNNVQQKPQIVAEYMYRDEEGNPLYKVIRFEPKKFMQAKYVNGEWIYKMSGVRYVLYNLPNVIKSDVIYFVEGEKDADNLNKIGLVATTTAGGASGFKKRASEYIKFLSSKIVYIIPDNDKAGYKYAEDIKNALEQTSAQIKVLKLSDEIRDLNEKQDISDVILKYGKDKTIEILKKLQNNEKDNENTELSPENIISSEIFEKLYEYELTDMDNYFKFYNEIKIFCNAKHITGFDKFYKLFKEAKRDVDEYDGNGLFFPDLNDLVYNTNRYELSSENFIYEVVPNIGKILVCYHPILPVEKYKNLEDDSEKIKIGFYKNNEWKYLIVDKSTISSSQSIVKLSDFGVAVTSENAKYLVKYLAEIENLNQDKIPINSSVSRLGWFKGQLVPYEGDFEIDNKQNLPNVQDKFSQAGELKDWIEFFKERRKYNNISRIIMAGAVSSILLKDLKQPGFTIHVYGESEYGKAQPLNTKIITPDGYKLMGDLKIGDKVIGGDGKPHKVTGIFPQGKKETYEITFVDGRKTKCCKEHLWNVTTITRRNHKNGYTVMSLEDMLKKPLKTTNGGFQYRIPLTKPVEFKKQEVLPIQPYLLGALIGDGCLTLTRRKDGSTEIYFNNSEKDIIKKVKTYLKEKESYLWKNKHTTNQYVLRNCKWLKDNIKKLNLNCKSTERFIPEIYKKASIADRYLLLQGLFDTDGNIGQKGELKYCTKSKKLAYDVLELCFSLGYRATIFNYKYRPDEYYVCISANKDIYSSKKHQNKMQYINEKRKRIEDTESLIIKSIEKYGEEECQCIMVDSKEHTYLCDDFIVTHNTVSCMVAQSIFGNPSLTEGKGIGINFNMTNVGLEYSLNAYNNIPLFINEMQHQKDAVDYDKLLFLISEGRGRTRALKSGGLSRENNWNNVAITNGEKNIIKDNSNAGAYNRCLSCEVTNYLYEDLQEVADFSKENYGTVIREILKHLSEYDLKAMYKKIYNNLDQTDTTNKQKILEAIILLGDKILTDIIFKDGCYLTADDFENKIVKKKDIVIEERAFEVIRDWYVSEKRHFLNSKENDLENQDIKVEIYGKDMKFGYVAILPKSLRKVLSECGYDYFEVLNAWKRKGYIKYDKNNNTQVVRLNGNRIRCVVLDMKRGVEEEEQEEIPLPF